MLTKLLKVHAWKEVNETVTWEQQSYEASEDAELPETKPMTAYERVQASRASGRPTGADYIRTIFHDFIELHGDRRFADDSAIVAGVAWLRDMPVTVIAIEKGKDLTERFKRNFGSPMPEGYRKALRLMKQAEKFRRPIFTFIDTAGAYPGLEAEEHGQGEAIARNLFEMSRLTVPVIAVITGEGNSGGALALAVADRVLMLENAVYAILSPEGFASILWKDAQRSGEAAELMKLTAPELKKLGVIDGIVREPEGGAQTDPSRTLWNLDRALTACLEPLLKESAVSLTERRYQKFRALGRGKEDA